MVGFSIPALDEAYALLWSLSEAKDAASERGQAQIHPKYSSLYERAKKVTFIQLNSPLSIDDLLKGVLLAIEALHRRKIEQTLEDAKRIIEIQQQNIQVLEDVPKIKNDLIF